MLFVCYPKCSTCQKAASGWKRRASLSPCATSSRDNPTEQELRDWHRMSGLPLKRFFNTSGLQYKALGLKDKLPQMSEDEQFACSRPTVCWSSAAADRRGFRPARLQTGRMGR